MFFCNSGAEANEAAIKLVRRWGLPQGRTAFVALDGSFHGRTIGALAATGQPDKRAPFEPLVDWFRFLPPDDVAALDLALTPDVAAVYLEPVMGEGGVLPLDRRLPPGRAGALRRSGERSSSSTRCSRGSAAAATGSRSRTPASSPTS